MGDVQALPAIEAAAGEAFREIGMADVADDPLPDTDDLARHVGEGRIWVAETAGEVAGYALAVLRDGQAHLEQVSVHPDHARTRVGAQLIGAVRTWTLERRDEQLRLTTFTDVPWNAPYYSRLGFRPLPDAELGPELTAEIGEERRPFSAPRTAMGLRLP
nr:GNAT family N-acetyltransferase [Brachybacterium equifaecis]